MTARKFVYLTDMGVIWRLTPTKWEAFRKASSKDWTDVGNYGVCLGSFRQITDWTPEDFEGEEPL